jgi:hypothetical protein
VKEDGLLGGMMTKKEQKTIIRRCGRCKYGGLETRAVHGGLMQLPSCFNWLHPGEMGGWGTEWAQRCGEFEERKMGDEIRWLCKVWQR